jgi:hypothetical protein
MRRASGPNPFTRGPSSSGVTLNCHDVSELLLLFFAVRCHTDGLQSSYL